MTNSIMDNAMARAYQGMELAAVAQACPERIAIYSAQGSQTFGELNARANQIARLLASHGIGAGDSIALLCTNRLEFVAVRFAAHRTGIRITPINWHLTSEEVAYIVDNCEARALFADHSVAAAARNASENNTRLTVKIGIGGEIEGFENYDNVLDAFDSHDISSPVLGNMMLYTSGTTGRPKGVFRKQADPHIAADMLKLMLSFFQYDPDSGNDLALSTGPLYHSGPFNICMTQPLSVGIGIVIMDQWDAEKTLQLIDQQRISHVFFVPTMFNRLLALPDSVREQYDVSSLKFVIHGAAPCAVDVKQRMMDWFGPVIWEIYAGTEGPGTIVSPQEWLSKPGTVGRPAPGQIKILSDDGQELPSGETGTVYITNPQGSNFEYFNDPVKTQAAIRDGYFTAGDLGLIDKDGYLFLTGRSAEVIIASGVNIYPQEIDDVLMQHPQVDDVACVGVPDAERGEEVKAIIQLSEGAPRSDEMAEELLQFAQDKLAKLKWPRSIDFIDKIPRSEAGKVQRRQLRSQYWQGEKQI